MFVLDIGQDAGALLVYTPPGWKDEEVEISRDEPTGPPHKIHTGVVQRTINGRPVCAAVFPSLKEGAYTFWRPEPLPQPACTVRPGRITELDWR